MAGETTAAARVLGAAIKLCVTPGLRGNVVLAGQRQTPIQLYDRLPARRGLIRTGRLFSNTAHHARDPTRDAGRQNAPHGRHQPSRSGESIPEVDNPVTPDGSARDAARKTRIRHIPQRKRYDKGCREREKMLRTIPISTRSDANPIRDKPASPRRINLQPNSHNVCPVAKLRE